jgi:hypothetical protein
MRETTALSSRSAPLNIVFLAGFFCNSDAYRRAKTYPISSHGTARIGSHENYDSRPFLAVSDALRAGNILGAPRNHYIA